jgi:hypothetical protein
MGEKIISKNHLISTSTSFSFEVPLRNKKNQGMSS